ncbi:MAG TPA: AarF/UbiB family protein [Anaerolineales bacterium]|nr:AarF/UbiB family protein [Anaerolineales bacterium]
MLGARYRRIVFFFARILAGVVFWDLILPRLGLRKLSRQNRPERLRRAAVQYRAMAIQLGGVLIKVGQFLSSRVDVLPREITGELAGLQDEVPPERFEDIRAVAEADLGMPLEEKYRQFDVAPLAAASLGQVHRACLAVHGVDPAGEEVLETLNVVVKVQRPNIQALIATDLAALRTVGEWLRRYPPIRKRANVPALLAEFTRTLYEEVDYLAEGRNAETFAANFKGQPNIRVPRIIWTHTTPHVLTLEDVGGIKITDYEAISQAGIDRGEVARRLLDTYLKQIFEDGFFHADPHPGNLFVMPLPKAPADGGASEVHLPWKLTFVDFGMVGRIPPETRLAMRELIIGVGTRDTGRVIRAYQMLGMLLPGADLKLIEEAMGTMFDYFWGKSMTELQMVDVKEMHQFAHQFSDLVYDMPFQIPQDIIFLGRAVGILSGMCTGLDPGFNLWEYLTPYAGKLLAEETAAGKGAWLDELGGLARKLVALPGRADAMLTKIERGDLVTRDPQLAEQVRRLERAVLKAAGSVVFAALLFGGIQFYLAALALPAGILWVGAALSLLWLLLSRPR